MATETQTLKWLVAIASISALGAGGAQFVPTTGPSAEVLQERIDGQSELFSLKMETMAEGMAGLKSSVDSLVVAGQAIAQDTGSIESSVRELGLTVAALRAQLNARIDADKAQDSAIADLQKQLAELRAIIENRP